MNDVLGFPHYSRRPGVCRARRSCSMEAMAVIQMIDSGSKAVRDPRQIGQLTSTTRNARDIQVGDVANSAQRARCKFPKSSYVSAERPSRGAGSFSWHPRRSQTQTAEYRLPITCVTMNAKFTPDSAIAPAIACPRPGLLSPSNRECRNRRGSQPCGLSCPDQLLFRRRGYSSMTDFVSLPGYQYPLAI
jgi:hypothetical protein